ncbi:NAD(P)H-quinone oxidoreductase chain 4 1 [Actinomyces bovis]|uniref:NAD(P)H-quinone oxidoreductase chain 4 1 n=2 Tax=Actinomyces bovis TaxID=1658 RepID=A0ABY1VNC9_9ACTO|nr:NAD(P)H-quinone oxidoreductase chain 4 1 [Actinomyces bovis]VEG52529.1 NAD(P)H-quinone oxidoreductase chain 4 1 [Actinomyces israelii]
MNAHILTIMAVIPLIGAAVVPWLRSFARETGLAFSLVILSLGIWALVAFDMSQGGKVQLLESYQWIPRLGVTWTLGVNALGLAMLLLAVFLVPLVLLASWGEIPAERQGSFTALVLSLEAFMVVIFTARDIFLFYICFEAMLIPVYFLIGHFGGPLRQRAALKFLLYSLAGGLVMLVGVVALPVFGTNGSFTYVVDALAGNVTASTGAARWMFISFMVAFAIKAPMFPVHTWLPDTAEQATPGTSVLLIGVLDKIGTYGMITLCLPLFPEAARWAAPVVLLLAAISIVWGALLAIGQDDLYRMISFTSISHFGFIVMGIFIGSQVAATGAMLYMVAHGLSIAGLYLAVGFLGRRTGTIRISELGGLARVAPVLAGTFLISGLASIALPGLSGFVPEWMVLTGTFSRSIALGVAGLAGVVLAAVYILLPYQRVFTGAPAAVHAGLSDLDLREKVVLTPVIAAMFVLGLAPFLLTDGLTPVSEQVSEQVTVATTVPTQAAAVPASPLTASEGSNK